ncbi:SdpI family protein [Nocardiopsis sp. YSL2]|uniref:SdpI family protein n=1 Tax=Nocardiopsis sp. YSL2 TaxID=2939492 RepID=UPI0026F4666F|nr:SdpI family protein [Nocardiopsis sp. YSL2]
MRTDTVLPHVWADQPLSTGTLVWLSIVLAVAAFVLITIGMMGRSRRLRPNGVVGIRTAYTAASHRAWYDVHVKAAPWLMASGAVLITGTVALHLTDIPRGQLTALMASIGVGTAVLLIGVRSAHSGARRTREGDRGGQEQEKTP